MKLFAFLLLFPVFSIAQFTEPWRYVGYGYEVNADSSGASWRRVQTSSNMNVLSDFGTTSARRISEIHGCDSLRITFLGQQVFQHNGNGIPNLSNTLYPINTGITFDIRDGWFLPADSLPNTYYFYWLSDSMGVVIDGQLIRQE